MAGHARYTALLDACVLYPILIADALLSLATEGLFAAKWTEEIEGEWIRNLEGDRPDLKAKLTVRRDQMRGAVPDWEVSHSAWGPLAGNIILPDDGDRHVVAAAIAGHCDCIVTANLRDFPRTVLGPFSIEAIHPDDFILAQLDLNPIAALTAMKEMRARKSLPELTAARFIDRFAANGLTRTAEKLREAQRLI